MYALLGTTIESGEREVFPFVTFVEVPNVYSSVVVLKIPS
jgi:hypothetical protein